MSVLAKSSVILLTALVVAGPNVAQAVVGPDNTFSNGTVHSTNRSHICLAGDCYGPMPIYGAVQSFDCDKAGLGNPEPVFQDIDWNLGDRLFRSGVDWGRIDAMNAELDSAGDTSSPIIIRDLHDDPSAYKSEFMQYWMAPDFGKPSHWWPGASSADTATGADKDPIKGAFSGETRFGMQPGFIEAVNKIMSEIFGAARNETYDNVIDQEPDIFDALKFFPVDVGSVNVETPINELPAALTPYLNQQYDLGDTTYSSLMFENTYLGDVLIGLTDAGIDTFETNPCRQVLTPTDPNYMRTGRDGGNSWGEKLDDQWAIKRVGFTGGEDSAWNLVPEMAASVVVAVIDTGLDWHHKDLSADNIWRNSKEVPDNGIDDDNNGYVDDIIGWDFLAKNNKPWDFDGHGTVVTGIIAAAHNDTGIAGIDSNVRIMVLKAVNNFGTTRASFIAEAIVYAVDNGAQIINISVGGPRLNRMEQAAIDYAYQEGVLVVAASGNEGIELDDYGPGGADHVLTVGATHMDDRAAAFSNYGDKVDLVAPGVDILSLRARYTDANYRPDAQADGEYTVGDNYVGDDKRYLHVSGTSFSTPIVAGTASLLLSKNPELTAAEVERILKQTATDVDFAGNDKYTGHGMVNAQIALSVDTGFSVMAEITGAELMPADAPSFVRVTGTVDATSFKRAWMQIGPGENPGGWRYVGQKHKFPVVDGTLGTIPIRDFNSSGLWQVVINVEHRNGVIKRAAFPIQIP